MENEQEPTHSTQKEEPVAPTPPPSTFPTPAHPLPKFLPKPIALIVIILIVGVLLSGLVFTVYTLGRNSVLKEMNPTAPETSPPGPVFQATPTPASNTTNADPTADWETYESSEYDFSIKYPPSVTHETTNGTTQSNTYNQSHEYFKVNGGTLEIYGLCGRGINPIKTESIVIAGIKTDKFYETETSGVIKAIDRPASNGQLCFDFRLPNNQNKDIVDSIFNQILSTLRFE